MDSSTETLPPAARRYPEDLADNLSRVRRLAPIHCTDCGGYHLSRAERRLRQGQADTLDRDDVLALMRDALARHQPSGTSFDILIAGCGDTNLLAICADASALVPRGPAIRYTVVDRCQTPLELCAAFARRHGLAVRTRCMGIGAIEPPLAADLIMVHSLLRFVPRAHHLATMGALRDWLKPGGSIVFSHRLLQGNDSIRAEYRTAEALIDLFAEAGLRVVVRKELREEQAGPGRDEPRRRLLAVLESAN